jgi:predicted secreted hydrolase
MVALLVAACGQPDSSGSGKAPWPGPFTATRPTPTPVAPVSFPRDEAPHDALTEWWYYTGHLRAADGAEYGFESVVFQSRRADFPPYYAGHVAITDKSRRQFRHGERTGAAIVGTGPGFDLRLEDWLWRGFEGNDQLEGRLPEYAFRLELTATKPPALHAGGYIDFGQVGGSYYYSRTRMAVRGTIEDHGVVKEVTGQAWFDHQWGDFLGTGNGGWDWFSVQLADGADLTLSLLRDEQLRLAGAYGTYVEADGRTVHIEQDELRVDVLAEWTSPQTGVTYPSGWRLTLPKQDLVLICTPVIPDQELDTRGSTGTIYWEGAIRVEGARGGTPVAGEGYVELTGYDRRVAPPR